MNDAEAERLLAAADGGDPEARPSETALFLRALRAAVPEQPAPALEAELILRLAEAARVAGQEAGRATGTRTRPLPRRARMPRRALVARAGIAVALIPASLAGLAFAGVTLPEPARSPLGIDLPNQPASDDDQAKNGDSATDTPTGEKGTAKGASSSQGNSDAAHQNALEQRQKALEAGGKAIGHERGKAIGLKGLEPPGHTGDTGPPPHSNAGGSPRSESAPGKIKKTAPPRFRGKG